VSDLNPVRPFPMNQLITIRPDGSITGLDFKRAGLDLRKLGKAQTERVSEVTFAEERQQWLVQYVALPGMQGNMTLFNVAQSKADLSKLTYFIGAPANTLYFPDYEDAVAAEVAVIQGLREQGLCL